MVFGGIPGWKSQGLRGVSDHAADCDGSAVNDGHDGPRDEKSQQPKYVLGCKR